MFTRTRPNAEKHPFCPNMEEQDTLALMFFTGWRMEEVCFPTVYVGPCQPDAHRNMTLAYPRQTDGRTDG